MSQPRKFSDKIALLMRNQAEDAEAFENILREVQPLTTGNITEVSWSSVVTEALKSNIYDNTSSGPPSKAQSDVNASSFLHSLSDDQANEENLHKISNHTGSTNQIECNEFSLCLATSESSYNSSLIPSVITGYTEETLSNFGKPSNSFSSESFSQSSQDNSLISHATIKQHIAQMTEHFPSSRNNASCNSLVPCLNRTCLNFETTNDANPQCNSISAINDFLEQQIPALQMNNLNYGEIFHTKLPENNLF